MKSKVWIVALLLIPCSLFLILTFGKKSTPLEFLPSEPCVSEKSFVFLIYAEDQPKNIEQNISSLLEQSYETYRLLLLETENLRPYTALIRGIVAKQNKSHLLTIISFEEKVPNVECFQTALDFIKEDEIVVQIACNDWLAHSLVLSKLNQIYSKSDEIWLTYSQYLEYPSYQKGTTEPYMKKMLRNHYNPKLPWLSSHLKVYYAGLFKELRVQTGYIEPSNLEMFFQPLAEYSKHHTRFIDDVLYVHTTKQ